VICLLVAVLFPASLFAQEKVSESEWKRGYHGFNMICEGVGLQHVTVDQAYAVPQNELVVVLFGDIRRIPILLENVISNGGSVLAATDSSSGAQVRTSGISFRPNRSYRTRQVDSFADYIDCPVVSDIRSHIITQGISEIATNRPGALVSSLNSRLAYLPYEGTTQKNKAFIAAMEYRRGGRIVGVADQSVFSNQMIIYRDNALFADQTIRWLKRKKQKYVLVISDGKEYSSHVPSDVVLDMPAPTSKEIVDAIKNLPPAALVEFANSVATVVEDDDLVNDFLHDKIDNVSDGKLNRFFIFLMFSVVCLSFIAAFLFQKKLLRHTGSEVESEKSRRAQQQQRHIQARERQWAAHVLLDSFCVDIANRHFNDWSAFPLGLELGDDREAKSIFKELTKASNLYKTKQSSYWSRNRLRQLERDTIRWRAWISEKGIVPSVEVVESANELNGNTVYFDQPVNASTVK